MGLADGILEIKLDQLSDGLILRISQDRDGDLDVISNADAQANGESPYRLLESRSYEYQLSKTGYQLKCLSHNGIVKPSKLRKDSEGRITTGNFVGTLTLEVGHHHNALELEVLATKFDDTPDDSYRKNYHTMLEDITEHCTELIMQANMPVSQKFEVDNEADTKTIYQRFSFIKSLISSDEFEEAILRITSSPKTSWTTEEEEMDTRSVRRFSRSNVRQLVTRNNRTSVPADSALYKSGITSVPTRIASKRKIENYDIPENQFIKHALTTYLRFFEDCQEKFNTKASYIKEKREAQAIIERLESFLQQPFFYDISSPKVLSIGSPVLQRKNGYRFVLRTWLMSELASKLTWKGGDDVYSAGKKDIATLYEYWVFFQLYKLLNEKFELGESLETNEGISRLISTSKDDLHINLKQGKFIALNGSYIRKNRKLRVKFAYNRSFSGGTLYKKNTAGSWTNTMRPDYTLSLWPAELQDTTAEKEEQIVHIHFDAKYKVHQFSFDTSEDEGHLSDIKQKERSGIYKNADILKMHAYKDAIRRTGGAYILYPGTEKLERKGFHEIIPGLGAFALNPRDDDKNSQELSKFIDEVTDHLLDRSSQREHIAVKRYEIHKDKKDSVVNEAIPEYINGKKLIPDETYVLVGYSKTPKRLKWYEENEMYNFRMDDNIGSLRLYPEVVNSQFLLLRENGKKDAGILYKLKPGIRVFSGKKLMNEPLKHPDATKESYLVYDFIKEDQALKAFKNVRFNFKELDGYKQATKGKNPISAAGLPFAVTLTDLMKTVIKD